MKKRRPTIPIGEWKLAVHLEATRKIQNQKGIPANDCDCDLCTGWKNSLDQVFPDDIIKNLTRIGIEPKCPTDFNKYGENETGESLRVIYHAVGKILSGPNQFRTDDLGGSLIYHPVRIEPRLSLVVIPQKQSYVYAPIIDDASAGMLICIDFRLVMPHKMSASPDSNG